LEGRPKPLMRRHVIILRKFGESTGYEHPHMRTVVGNYVGLLEAMKLPAGEYARGGSVTRPEGLRQVTELPLRRAGRSLRAEAGWANSLRRKHAYASVGMAPSLRWDLWDG
jgi:hypothetical protein